MLLSLAISVQTLLATLAIDGILDGTLDGKLELSQCTLALDGIGFICLRNQLFFLLFLYCS